MRLIDGDALIDKYGEWYVEELTEIGYIGTIKRIVDSMPTIEPKHKKGKWIKVPEFCGDDVSGFIDNHFSCSECKKEAEINPWGFYILSDFCPNCGADMRGKKDD